MEKRTVLFCVAPTCGGAERVTLTIAKMLDSEQYDIHVAIVGRAPADISAFIPSYMHTHCLKIRNIWDFTTFRLVLLICKLHATIAFCSLRYLNLRVILACKLAGIKSIVRNDNALATLRWDNKAMMKIIYPMADIVVAQQDEMRKELLEKLSLRSDRVLVLYNPIDTDSIDSKSNAPSPYSNDEDAIRYVSVARVHYSKGQDILIRSFAKVYQNRPTAHLYIVGRYCEKDSFFISLKRFISANELEKNVHFVGFDENPYRWIRYCDCFVLPSRIEGLPNALIEAQYLGRPCVASVCVPVIDRMIEDGINGYKVPPENADLMANAMLNALKLEQIRMGYHSAESQDFVRLFE